MTLDDARDILAAFSRGQRRPGRVVLDEAGVVAHLRIDNPAARGAMTVPMMVDLAEAVRALRSFRGSLVVVSSTDPRAFCAGGHLGEVSRVIDTPEAAERMTHAMSTVLDALADLPVPSVAAIDGAALGGGAEIVTACDWRVAGPESRIHFVHTRLGIVPGWGGTGRLVRIVGRRSALRVLTSARPLKAEEGQSLGLVDLRCDGPAVPAALAWLEDLLSLSPEAVRAAKAQVVASAPSRPAGVEL